jgi:putative membrane protein insertion efficiency factor
VLLGLIRVYKVTLSPLIGRQCRYLPTCSDYAADAVRQEGGVRGSFMAVARVCRCHPWGGHGYDPVPERVVAPRWAPWMAGDWRWRGRWKPDPAPEDRQAP